MNLLHNQVILIFIEPDAIKDKNQNIEDNEIK